MTRDLVEALRHAGVDITPIATWVFLAFWGVATVSAVLGMIFGVLLVHWTMR